MAYKKLKLCTDFKIINAIEKNAVVVTLSVHLRNKLMQLHDCSIPEHNSHNSTRVFWR